MVGFARIRKALDGVRARVAKDRPLDYAGYAEIAGILGLPPDYVKGEGIFRKWEQVIRYYDYVSLKLRQMIPGSMYMSSVHEEKLLCAWLDWTRYFPPHEVEFQRARWFAFAVADIEITPLESDDEYDEEERAEVEITFTPEFEALVELEKARQAQRGGAIRSYTMRQAFIDFIRDQGGDEREAIKAAIAGMSDGSFVDEAAAQAGFDSDAQD